MNRRRRKKLFKKFKVEWPDARATRCFRQWMFNFNDSGYNCFSWAEDKKL